MKVTQFQTDHLEEVNMLFREVGLTPIDKGHLLFRLQSPLYWQLVTYVLPENGLKSDLTIAGVALGRQIADEIEVDELAVATPYRRRGIGKALLIYALHQGWLNGGRHIYLEVRAGNNPAKELYYKLGFSVLRQRRGYYHSPPDDALELGLTLKDNFPWLR
jgi:ribosomal protein S18 acetylase RimI-like enzyme